MLTLPDGSTLPHALDFADMPEDDLVNAIVLTLREGDTTCHDQTIRVRRVAVGYSVKIDGLFAAHASTMADLASAMHTARCLARRRAKWKDAAGIYALMAGAVGGLWGWHWLTVFGGEM